MAGLTLLRCVWVTHIGLGNGLHQGPPNYDPLCTKKSLGISGELTYLPSLCPIFVETCARQLLPPLITPENSVPQFLKGRGYLSQRLGAKPALSKPKSEHNPAQLSVLPCSSSGQPCIDYCLTGLLWRCRRFGEWDERGTDWWQWG